MQPVIDNLAKLPEADLAAMADYILSIQKRGQTRQGQPTPASQSIPLSSKSGGYARGESIFTAACSSCHESTAPMMDMSGRPSLAQSTTINADDARDTVQTILGGIGWPDEPRRAIYMPPFEAVLSDQDLTDLAEYLRARFTAKPIWTDVAKTIGAVHKAREPI